MPLSLGDKLGPYEILAPIGAGGMGDVYKACVTNYMPMNQLSGQGMNLARGCMSGLLGRPPRHVDHEALRASAGIQHASGD